MRTQQGRHCLSRTRHPQSTINLSSNGLMMCPSNSFVYNVLPNDEPRAHRIGRRSRIKTGQRHELTIRIDAIHHLYFWQARLTCSCLSSQEGQYTQRNVCWQPTGYRCHLLSKYVKAVEHGGLWTKFNPSPLTTMPLFFIGFTQPTANAKQPLLPLRINNDNRWCQKYPSC
jgi:hypothetical protein